MPVVATEDFSGAADVALAGKTTTTGGLAWSGIGAFASNRAGLKLTGGGRLKSTVADSGAAISTGSANHYAQGVWYNIQTTNAYTGLLLSVVDHNNYILVAPLGNATLRILKRIAGVTTVVATISTSLSNGVFIRAEKSDGVVKVYKDSVQVGLVAGYSIPDAAVATSTNAGIWAPVFTAGADIMDDFEAGTLGGAEPPSLTIGGGPAVNSVYQRSPGSTSKTVPVSGTYAGTAPTDLQAQIETAGGAVVSAWATITGATIGGGAWSASVTVPQRPEWLVLRLRSRDAGGAVLASAATSQFGVGVLVMIDGQSNGVGLGSVSGGVAPSVPCAKWNGSAWSTSITGAGERALVQELASQLGVIVGIGNSAANGTGISAHVPPSATHWLTTADMVTAMGGDCELLAWLQGESDAAGGVDVSASYSASLQSIATGMLTLTGRTDAQFRMLVGVMGRNDGGSGANVGWQSVRVGQANAAAAHAAIDISHDCVDLTMADTLHYDAAGCAEAGYRFARSALRWLGGGAYDARGPRIASASRVGDVVTVAFDLNGSASITGAGALTGWEFFNGSAWAAATDATRVGNTVTFTGPAATAVRHLYGADPDVSNLARGNLTPSSASSIGLPVEPTRSDVTVTAVAMAEGSSTMARSVRNFVTTTTSLARSVRNFVGGSSTLARSVAGYASGSTTLARSIAAAGFATGTSILARSVRGYASGSTTLARSISGTSFVTGSTTLARRIAGYVTATTVLRRSIAGDGSIVWPATRAGEANTARVPFTGVRIIVPDADDEAAPVKAVPLYLADTEILHMDWAAKYLPGAGDAADTLLAVDVPAGLTVTPSVAPGGAATSGVITLVVTPLVAGTHRVSLRLGTDGGRESTGLVDIVVTEAVESVKTFRLRSTADRDVFDLAYAKYLDGADDASSALLSVQADAGITADGRLDTGAVVQLAVDNPSAPGTYQVRAQLQTVDGRRKTAAIDVEVLA